MRDTTNRNARSSINDMPLNTLIIYPAPGCSLICQYCLGSASRPIDEAFRQYLPVEVMKTAIQEALPLGLHTVQLSGGDACTHPDFDRLIGWLESLGLNLVIETFGDGVTQERASRLARLPHTRVLVGLPGSEMAEPGVLQAASAARMLSEAGLAPQMVVGVRRSNAGQLKDMIRMAEEVGSGALRFVSPRPDDIDHRGLNGRNGHNGHNVHKQLASDLLMVEEQIALGWRIERKLAQSTTVRLFFDQPPAFRGLCPPDPFAGQGRCNLQNSFTVLSSGEYALCGLAAQAREFVFDSVGSQPLERIWREHPVLLNLRAGLPERLQGVCDRCVMKSACQGNCPAENFLQSGSFFTPYWFCETAERLGLFPASRLIENSW